MEGDFRVGHRLVIPSRNRIVRDSREVRVEPKAMGVLLHLAKRPGEVADRDELIRAVWPDTFVTDDALKRCISELRKALGDRGAEFIETIPKRGCRLAAPVVREIDSSVAEDVARARRRRRVRMISLSAAAGIILLVGSGYAVVRNRRLAWAYGTALPEIQRLGENQDFDEAFRLIREAERVIPSDSRVQHLKRNFSRYPAIDSDPSGADVFVRGYGSNKDWLFVGRTPLKRALIPAGFIRWRIVKGSVALDATSVANPPTFHFVLPRSQDPEGMVFFPAGPVPGDGTHLDDFWLDRHEVTNAAYRKFVLGGGYERKDLWKHPFVKDGVVLTWRNAMSLFRDTTGRAGPANWVGGTYPAGQESLPVGGVSWFEAAAYAEFVGKALPTYYHWLRASALRAPYSEQIALASNFRGTGPLPVGHTNALSSLGVFDIAGNIREWSLSGAGNGRLLLGGGWGDPLYIFFSHPDASTPFDRSAKNGIRCAQYSAALPQTVLDQVVDSGLESYLKREPVDDEQFEGIRRLYEYDRLDLHAKVESVDTGSPWWTDESISLAAGYGGERLTTHLLLPRQFRPPYQAVVFYPGDAAFFTPWAGTHTTSYVDFLLQNGRAVIYPIYKGMHGRVAPSMGTLGGADYRDLIAQWYKDLSQSINYLETRQDIDSKRLAFYGFSRGGMVGPILTALEPRFRVSVLLSGGFWGPEAPEIEVLNFLPRVKMPTLVTHGQYDSLRPLDSNIRPWFQRLGTPDNDKRLAVTAAGHIVPLNFVIKETLMWLDRYLGSVTSPPRPS